MRRLLLAATLTFAVAAAPAHAAPPEHGGGQECGYVLSSGEDPVGTVYGGPLVVNGVAPGSLASLTCTIREGWFTTHTAPSLAAASGPAAPVAVLPPAPVSFRAPADGGLTLCASITVTEPGGATSEWYWDAGRAEFSADPAVWCEPPPVCLGCTWPPFTDLVDEVNKLFVDYVDPAICPVLAEHFPPEGDVPDLWDCPPYGG